MLCHQLVASPRFHLAQKVALYKSFRGEVDLGPLLDLSPGQTYYLPKIDAKAKTMEFYPFRGSDALAVNSWGLSEPLGDEDPLIADGQTLIIVPGLAFDKKGYRLGYGKGFYDRYLTGRTSPAIGVCFAEFLVESLPFDAHDQRVEDVFTELGPLSSQP